MNFDDFGLVMLFGLGRFFPRFTDGGLKIMHPVSLKVRLANY